MNKEGWTYKRLGEVISEYSERCRENEYPIYSVTNSQGFCQQFFGKRVASSDIANYKVVPKGYFAYNPSRINVGSIACQNKEMKVCVSPLYTVFSSSNQIDTSFLLYFLKSPDCNYIINAYARGTVRNNLKFSQLEKIKAPVPPLSVQQRIVSELDQLSDIIAMKRKQVEEYDALTQSLFYEMFGDPIVNEKEWPTSTYGDSFSIGSGGTPSKTVKEYWENGTIPWIGSNMCQNTVLYKTDGKFITEEGLNNSSAKILQPGTILVALVGATIGKVALLECETAINQNIAFVKHDDTTDSYFLYYYTMGLYPMFQNVGNGKFKMANQKFVKELPVALPPLPLQHAFADKVRAIERQKQLVNDSIRELQTLLDSRMQEYFG